LNKTHLVGQANELLAATHFAEQRMWACSYEDIKDLTSVCLDSDNPDYKLRTEKYNPTAWKVDN